MTDEADGDGEATTEGEQLVLVLAALANPHRLRILGALQEEPRYVSQLARTVSLGRPLVHMHLQRLEAAGLVHGRLELSPDGKAMKFFEIIPFALELTPELIARAATSIRNQLDHDQGGEQ